ncbi:hypothetical protein C9374_009682 [Naegleria lovaniensis]|uniref:Uncharacterized protein n=1 Tax=Naegleria lovaniensis TaxID=51637 RepID=A0AA88H1L3_NAELO|nr:uncharacterized protein C9374_009682 [Naegleria lovaniensis]KAG2393105.1 hypothetical protein C9374_009682 [Naegleria lovaniensis]
MDNPSLSENSNNLKGFDGAMESSSQSNDQPVSSTNQMLVDEHKEEFRQTQNGSEDSTQGRPNSVVEVERRFQESKEILLDLIHEVTHLQREQELAKYQAMCSKESPKASFSEISSLSSLVKRHELEREKMECQYKERIKEVSNERDLLMRESLETKLHLDAHAALVEKIKKKNIELECNVNLLQEQNKKLIASLTGYHQEKEKYETTFEKIKFEMESLQSKVKAFEENASVVASEQEHTKNKFDLLEKLLNKTMTENAQLIEENMMLKRKTMIHTHQQEK